MATKYVQTNTLYLSGSGVVVGATSLTLTSLTDIYGNVLTMTDFGSVGYGTLEPDTTNEESFVFTGITPNANSTYTLTGVQTTLAKSPYTASSGLVRSHAGGTKAVITDNVSFWATFANKNNDETIFGNWTFNTAPSSLSATPASTTALGNLRVSVTPLTKLGTATITIASPAVVTLASHGLTLGDTVQFTTTGALPTGLTPSANYYVISSGLTANAFEISATPGGTAVNTSGTQSGTHALYRTTPVAVGNDDPRVTSNAYGVSATGTDDYAITLASAPAAYAAGQVYAFKADVANTGGATLNVNGLGAKAITKHGATALATNDIPAGSIAEVRYDGTQFQLTTPTNAITTVVTSHVYGAGSASKNLADANAATQTIAHGLGVAPTKIRMRFAYNGSGGSATFSGFSDGSWITGGSYVATVADLIEGTSTATADAIAIGNSYVIKLSDPASNPATNFQTATVTVDGSNITLTWSKTGTPTGTVTFFWEAEGITTATP
jgi:hypothetical protein